jgi:Trk K+ transport system NAD-binding subunit
MYVVIAGGGKVGRSIAVDLLAQDWSLGFPRC